MIVLNAEHQQLLDQSQIVNARGFDPHCYLNPNSLYLTAVKNRAQQVPDNCAIRSL
jgi:hypothetical protein